MQPPASLPTLCRPPRGPAPPTPPIPTYADVVKLDELRLGNNLVVPSWKVLFLAHVHALLGLALLLGRRRRSRRRLLLLLLLLLFLLRLLLQFLLQLPSHLGRLCISRSGGGTVGGGGAVSGSGAVGGGSGDGRRLCRSGKRGHLGVFFRNSRHGCDYNREENRHTDEVGDAARWQHQAGYVGCPATRPARPVQPLWTTSARTR